MSDSRSVTELLESESAIDRLHAARLVRDGAEHVDEGVLRRALAAESDAWVKKRLRQALERTHDVDESSPTGTTQQAVEDAEQFARDVRALVTQELTHAVIHELSLHVGSIERAAAGEIENFKSSATHSSIGNLGSFLEAMRALHRASAVPSPEGFNLTDLVLEVVKGVRHERAQRGWSEIAVDLARDDPVAAGGDRALVGLALVNVLRNALEASSPEFGGDGAPVVVNWGVTDRDAWIAVLDRGIGLPAGSVRMVEPGVTNKKKDTHSGFGLPISKMAIESLQGTMTHRPREPTGVVCEIRWRTEA